jgi:protein TonB
MSATPRQGLRPSWLRPTTLALVVAAHAGLLALAQAGAALPPSLESMEVALIPEGDSVADQTPLEDIKPQQEKTDAPTPPPPSKTAELAAPPPQQVAPEAPPLPVAKPKPIVEPKDEVAEDDDEPRPAELREIERKKRLAEKRRREAQERREERRAQEGRLAAHRGVVGGSQRASGMSRASFAGLVSAELNRHKFYPAAARSSGVTGSVGVAFTIGPSGRIVSQSVTRSSGSGVLDGAAHAIMSSIHTPPPPGGRFSTSTVIQFHLN